MTGPPDVQLDPVGTAKRPRKTGPKTAALAFTEADAWQGVGAGWQPLFGSFQTLGLSFEWHDFQGAQRLDWGRSFHPGSVEICLNLAGHGQIVNGHQQAQYGPLTAGFYARGSERLAAHREPGERHQFVTVEFSPSFLARHLAGQSGGLHPLLQAVVDDGQPTTGLGPASRLTHRQQQLAGSLRQPPVHRAAQSLWYQGKALELMAEFFVTPPGGELFCVRQQRLAQERVERVLTILREDLAEPPSLEEISRRVGCSQFYLSRTFSAETGLTLPQCLRQLRLERAAELLRSGQHNVTEAALEVGYSSLSHFSHAFHQTFGCCPGLYPLATPTQRAVRDAD